MTLERHFRHTTLAEKLDGLDPRVVRNWIKAGCFGAACLKRGNLYFVPVSGVAHFFANHQALLAQPAARTRTRGLRRGAAAPAV